MRVALTRGGKMYGEPTQLVEKILENMNLKQLCLPAADCLSVIMEQMKDQKVRN